MTGGILVIDKPVGITSHNVISKLRYLLDEQKIGHCGTLDPMASGILPIMVGKAVKASEYLVDHDKRYFAGIKLGITTDTQDMTGNIISQYGGDLPTFGEFSEVLPQFTGEIEQTPPMYSALKVGGIKLVNLARDGITVERKPRKVTISSCVPSQKDGKYFLDIKCSKGTYIRTLCADIGKALGCGACMESLDRTEVGRFTKDDAIPFDSLNDMTIDEIKEKMIPVDRMFDSLPSAYLNSFFLNLYRNGEKIKLSKLKFIDPAKGDLWRIYYKDRFHSLGTITEIDGCNYFCMKKLF